MRGQVGRSVAALSLVGGAILGACGTGDEAGGPDVEIEAQDVASAAATSITLPYRFDATMSLGEVEDVPVLTGMWDGERGSFRMDLEPMVDAMGSRQPEFEGLDLTLEMVTEGTTTYVHGPDIGDLAQDSGAADSSALMAAVADLGEGWGRIDLAALGPDVGPEVLSQLTVGQNMDPRVFLDMLARTEDVEPLGHEEIDGVATTGAAADVSFVDMLEAQGLDVAEVTAGMIEQSGASEEEGRRIVDAFMLPMAVWIDGDDHVRRFTMDLGAAMKAIADELGEDLPDGGFTYSMTVDFRDYGDTSIAVVVPDPATTVDITDTVRSALAAG